MERSSNKHSPRVDEEMKKEAQSFTQGAPVESRAQESREKEDTAAEQPERHDLARFLEGSIFPASRGKIIANAERMHAPPSVVQRLRELPSRTYHGFPEVWDALKAS